MKGSERRIQCNEEMMPGRDGRKLLGWKSVRCMKDSGHEGNHACRTKAAYFEWWNKAKNPQKPNQEATYERKEKS